VFADVLHIAVGIVVVIPDWLGGHRPPRCHGQRRWAVPTLRDFFRPQLAATSSFPAIRPEMQQDSPFSCNFEAPRSDRIWVERLREAAPARPQ
jgi:hypothetical protein